MERVIIYYHSADLDGLCSGAIAKMAMMDKQEKNHQKLPITMVGVDYPLSEVLEKTVLDQAVNATVIIVDFCFSPSTMQELNILAEELIWIDHHVSSIQGVSSKMGSIGAIKGKQEVGKAACELAWEYFYHFMPMLPQVQLLGMYDTFRHKKPLDGEDGFVDHVMPFQLYSRTQLTGIEEFFTTGFFAGEFLIEEGEEWMNLGNAMNIYRKSALKKAAGINGKLSLVINGTTHDILGKFFVINSNEFSSAVSDHLTDEVKSTINGTIVWAMLPNGGIRYGFYKEILNLDQGQDLSLVAKSIGGGGHKHAAGAVTNTTPEYVDNDISDHITIN